MALKGKGRRAIQAAVDSFKPIIGHGSLAARFVQDRPYGGWGMLPQAEAEILERSIKRCGQVFVVWSYDTPIGWRDDMGWRVPDVRYSVTTSSHQSVVRAAVDNPGFYSNARW